MVSPEALSDTETKFEALGKQLKDAMSTYVGHLKREKLPLPSFAPSIFKPPMVKHPDGAASKLAIIELSQQICSMTMDPAMNLLISSLQVSSSCLLFLGPSPLTFGHPQFHFCSCLKVAIDLHVHKHVPQHGKIVASDLAIAVGADEALLSMWLRVLVRYYLC
jgi:hypothetical protein